MTAGYSGTPLPKKLGIREGSRVALLGAPEGFMSVLGDLPQGVSIRTMMAEIDLQLAFSGLTSIGSVDRSLLA